MTSTWHDRTFNDKTCVGCGETFTPTVGYQIRCQPDCGKAKQCVVCGAEFIPHRNRARQQKACSPTCARSIASYAEKPCATCGEMFAPTSPRARYCSDACKLGAGQCMNCGRSFVPSKDSTGKFCSRECWSGSFAPVGATKPGPQGYVLVRVPEGAGDRENGRWKLAHRWVMELMLGRKLDSHENVHHVDGNRANNDPSNLELWRTKQPKGVRPADYHCPGCRCHEIE